MRGFQTLAVLLLGAAAHAMPQPDQDPRVLSLFSVVNFPNVQCDATENEDGGALSGLKGTCLSSTECSDAGGEHKGNCAAGFGVCCVKSLKACGGTVSHNNTYIANVDYPTVLATGVNSCAYTIQRQGDICQLRLDFQDVALTAGAAGLVDNTVGRIVAAGGSGIEPPAVSGAISGDHMYVEVRDMDPTITVTTVAGTTNQKWNIQVSQIACDSYYKAPVGCTQYFLENSGTVRSYNTQDANAMQELSSQNMRICIRQNEGMCGVILTSEGFNVGAAAGGTMAGSVGATCDALTGSVVIPGGGIFCENIFSGTEDATVDAVVTVKAGPVSLTHLTDAAATAGATGFVLKYSQI